MKPKYNIAFLMNGAKPPRGGEFLTLHLIKNLRKEIFHPLVIYAEEGIIIQKIKQAGIDTIRIPLSNRITSIYPREITLYNPLFILNLLWHLFWSGGVVRVRRLLKKNNIALIYCADNLSKIIGGMAGKWAGIPVVAHCHDDFKEDFFGRLSRLLYLTFLDRIISVSEKVRSFFRVKNRISQKVITIYNGVDIETFNPERVDNSLKKELSIKDDCVVIGSIGVIEKDKGQRYLIEAIAKLKSEAISDIVCIICGKGPEDERLKEFVRAKNLTDKVLFLGFREDISRVLRVLDVMVMASLTIESFSMATIEAMAMRVPVIGTKVGALPEVIKEGETGILVPPRDIDALCESLRYLINNPQVRIQMGKNGRRRVLERFTIEKNIRKTEALFLQLLGTE